MAGYGYRGSYTTYDDGEPPRTDWWSKRSQSVFMDADGRRKPIKSYTANGDTECYVTKTETVVELSCVYRYKQSSPLKRLWDYGDDEGKWNRPSSPVRYHAEEKWNRYSSPVHDGRPQLAQEYITKVKLMLADQKNARYRGIQYRPQQGQREIYTRYGDQGAMEYLMEAVKPFSSGHALPDAMYRGIQYQPQQGQREIKP